MNEVSTATRLINLFLIHSLLKNCLTSVFETVRGIGILHNNSIKKTSLWTLGASVFQILYFVDSNKPVLGGVCFL